MIDLKNKELSYKGKTLGIIRFEVWWRSPLGLYDDGSKAIADLEAIEAYQPGIVVAVPVAIDEENRIEELR